MPTIKEILKEVEEAVRKGEGYEFMEDLPCTVSTNKVRELTEEDRQKLADAIKQVFTDAEEVFYISKLYACSDFFDCDEEAANFSVFTKNFSYIVVHVCISDPDNPTLVFNDLLPFEMRR